jgi:hypothetical protein
MINEGRTMAVSGGLRLRCVRADADAARCGASGTVAGQKKEFFALGQWNEERGISVAFSLAACPPQQLYTGILLNTCDTFYIDNG